MKETSAIDLAEEALRDSTAGRNDYASLVLLGAILEVLREIRDLNQYGTEYKTVNLDHLRDDEKRRG